VGRDNKISYKAPSKHSPEIKICQKLCFFDEEEAEEKLAQMIADDEKEILDRIILVGFCGQG